MIKPASLKVRLIELLVMLIVISVITALVLPRILKSDQEKRERALGKSKTTPIVTNSTDKTTR